MMETAKATATFGEKLIDLIREIAKPAFIRREGKAYLKSLEGFAAFQQEHPDIDFSCDENGLQVSVHSSAQQIDQGDDDSAELATEDAKKLLAAACEDGVAEAKASNIAGTLSEAAKVVPADKAVSAEPVDQDWALHFFDYASYASDDEVRAIWARILAGEISKPGSCSIRTMTTLSQLSRDEARTFEKVSKSVVWSGDRYFVSYERENKMIEFADAAVLQDAGLLAPGDGVNYTLVFDEEGFAPFPIPGFLIRAKMRGKGELAQHVMMLSVAGTQLFRLLNVEGNLERAKRYSQALSAKEIVDSVDVYRLISFNETDSSCQYEKGSLFHIDGNASSD